MVEWFDIDDINKAPGRLDFAKLADVNAHYIRQTSVDELLKRIKDYLADAEDGPALGAAIEATGWDKLAAALPSLKERAKTLKELVDGAGYLLAVRPLQLDDKAAKLLDADARSALAKLLAKFEAINDWQVQPLEAAVRDFAEESGVKLGKIAQPLRAVLTGKAVSPPVFDVMTVLGRDEALARIRDQVQ
jgi:glutamyl-tRNA synthetase